MEVVPALPSLLVGLELSFPRNCITEIEERTAIQAGLPVRIEKESASCFRYRLAGPFCKGTGPSVTVD